LGVFVEGGGGVGSLVGAAKAEEARARAPRIMEERILIEGRGLVGGIRLEEVSSKE
jgi:hypothetical protein